MINGYFEEDAPEVEVALTAKMVKLTTIESCGAHLVKESEREPDGSITRNWFWEYPDLKEDFLNQSRTLKGTLEACCKVLEQLNKDGQRWYAGIYIPKLLDECEEWDCEEFEVEEG
jgi:hypothetical protein